MKGRLLAFFITISLPADLCLAQVYDPNFSRMGTRNGSVNGAHVNNISGVVIGSDGVPVADARVELRNERTGTTVASGYTNSAGVFEFEGLPNAPYELVATHGLAEAHERLSLNDMAVSLKIRLSTGDAAASQADGKTTVSIAEYRVPQKARDAFHKAEIALSKNRHDEVNKQLGKALEIWPSYAPALTLRGVMSLDGANPKAAIDDFDKAIHADPSFALAYTAMAAALNQLDKFDDALRSADRAITLAPRSWQPYFEIAKAYVGKADYQHALQQLAKAQGLNPKDYAPIHLVRAHAMLALKDYNTAMNELQIFLTLAPQDPNSTAARQTLEKVKAFTTAAATPAIIQSAR